MRQGCQRAPTGADEEQRVNVPRGHFRGRDLVDFGRRGRRHARVWERCGLRTRRDVSLDNANECLFDFLFENSSVTPEEKKI